MKFHSKRIRGLFAAILIALLVQPFVATGSSPTAHASAPVTAPVVAASGTSTGVWIIGGLAFSVASIIACGMIVGAEEGREMTLEEAMLSGAIPLGCLFREQLGVSPTP